MTLSVNTTPGGRVREPVRFVCPSCRYELVDQGHAYHCRRCRSEFPQDEGVHRFFIAPGAGDDMRTYTEMFQSIETASSYARSFERVPRKRWRTRRELNALKRLLDGDPGPSVLNIPCGSGRLSPPLHGEAVTLLEADSSPGQITLNRRRFGDRDGRIFLTASAFDIPLPDGAVDTVVCARLSHHLQTAEDRERLLAELLRVARRRVVFSFRNRISLSSFSRRLRGKPVHPTAMTLSEVRTAAQRHGARVNGCRSVSNLGARHTYALIVKRR